MKTYLVGGAVRDRLLGLPVKDRDWVVVGATPEVMRSRGFRPVGRDFPVFIEPQTGEEYALARTERKSGQGYQGFVFCADPSVTLEEDLQRRDLTINAMAMDEAGTLVDPLNGAADLHARVLRHVGPAFGEDPVRILRVARFAARFPDFSLAPETLGLMQAMVSCGEVNHLVAERVWQELARGLMEIRPSRMLEVLRACGALAVLLPEIDALFRVPERPEYHPEGTTGAHLLLCLDWAARQGYSLDVRWATLLHDIGKALTPPEEWPRHHGHESRGRGPGMAVCERLKVPVSCRDLALLAIRWHGHLYQLREMRATTVTRFLEQVDLSRRPERFQCLLEVGDCDHHGRALQPMPEFQDFQLWKNVAGAFRSLTLGPLLAALPAEQKTPERIAAVVHEARCRAVQGVLKR